MQHQLAIALLDKPAVAPATRPDHSAAPHVMQQFMGTLFPSGIPHAVAVRYLLAPHVVQFGERFCALFKVTDVVPLQLWPLLAV
jgi:hypothetical protein